MTITLFRSVEEQGDIYRKDKGSLAELARDSDKPLAVSSQIGRNSFLHSQQRDRIDVSLMQGGKAVSHTSDHFQNASQRAVFANDVNTVKLAVVSSNRIPKNGLNKNMFNAVDKFPNRDKYQSAGLALAVAPVVARNSK